jgi:hypothetical protein
MELIKKQNKFNSEVKPNINNLFKINKKNENKIQSNIIIEPNDLTFSSSEN